MSDVRAVSRLKRCLTWCVLGSCLLVLPNGAQSATSDSATLQWSANQEANLTGYRIYRGTNPGVYGVPTTVGKITTYQYANLLTDKTHYFTITAFDASGNESLPSPEVKKYIANSSNSSGASSPPPPSSLTHFEPDRGQWGRVCGVRRRPPSRGARCIATAPIRLRRSPRACRARRISKRPIMIKRPRRRPSSALR